MPLINPANLTWNGKEIQSLSEAIFVSGYNTPAVTQLFTVQQGIKAKQQIAILGLLGLVGTKKTNCTITPNSGTIPMSEKFWLPANIADRFEACWADLEASFFVWGTKNGINKADLTDTDFAAFVQDRIGIAMTEAVMRMVFFGDTALTFNATTSGQLNSSAGDLPYFTPIDGLWKQIFAIGTATPARRITIAKNAAASYALQEFDAADVTNKTVTGILRSMKYGSDWRLRSQADLRFIVTQSMADQYAAELANYTNVEASYNRIEGGYLQLMFEGIPVIGVPFMDRYIRSYFANGTVYYRPHRAVLTDGSNLQVATEETGNLSEMSSFYDQRDKKYIIDYAHTLDAKVIQDHMIQAAY